MEVPTEDEYGPRNVRRGEMCAVEIRRVDTLPLLEILARGRYDDAPRLAARPGD